MHHDAEEYSEGGDGQSSTSDSGNSSDRVANLQDLTETPRPIIHQQQQRYFMIKPTMDVPTQDQFDSQQETVRTQFYVEIPTPETMEEGCRLDTNITIEVVDSILPYLTKGYEPDGIPEGIKHICLPTRHIKMIRRKNILKHRGAIIVEIPLANIKKVNKRREIAKTYGIPDRCFNGSKWYLGNTTIVRVEEKYVFILIVRQKESEDIPWNCYEKGVTRTAWLAKNCGIDEINILMPCKRLRGSSWVMDIEKLYEHHFPRTMHVTLCLTPNDKIFEVLLKDNSQKAIRGTGHQRRWASRD